MLFRYIWWPLLRQLPIHNFFITTELVKPVSAILLHHSPLIFGFPCGSKTVYSSALQNHKDRKIESPTYSSAFLLVLSQGNASLYRLDIDKLIIPVWDNN